MARVRIELPQADDLLALVDDEGRFAVRVTPGARAESMDIADAKLLVKIRARAEGGKANDAVRALLAKAFGIAPSRLELLRGASARDKLFRIVD